MCTRLTFFLIACFSFVSLTNAQIKDLDIRSYEDMNEKEAIMKFDTDFRDSIIISVYDIKSFFIEKKYAFIENLVLKHNVSPEGFLEYINAQRMRCGVDLPRAKKTAQPTTCKQVKTYTSNEYTNAKLKLVEVLINAGDSATKRSFESCVQANELDVLKLLVNKSNNNFAISQLAEGVMDEACYYGNMSFVEYLIEIGVSPNSKNENSYYAIYRAVAFPEIFFYLISKGADYQIQGYNSTTPIIHAARVGCMEVLHFFVEKKVNPYELHGAYSAITMARNNNKVNSKEVIALLKTVTK